MFLTALFGCAVDMYNHHSTCERLAKSVVAGTLHMTSDNGVWEIHEQECLECSVCHV